MIRIEAILQAIAIERKNTAHKIAEYTRLLKMWKQYQRDLIAAGGLLETENRKALITLHKDAMGSVINAHDHVQDAIDSLESCTATQFQSNLLEQLVTVRQSLTEMAQASKEANESEY